MPAAAHDRGMVVDRERHARACPGGCEISHALAPSPEERVRLARSRLREAHHLTAVVHIVRDARRPPQRPEVDHAARLGNEEGALGQRPGDPAVPRHLPRSIDGAGLALVPAERAEIEARAFG